MKKLAAALMAMVLTFGMTSVIAQEAPAQTDTTQEVTAQIKLTEDIALEMEVPEGYEVVKDRSDSALYATISSEEEGKPLFNFSIAYADLSEGPTPGEMTQEDIDLAMQMVSSDFYKPTFTIAAAGGGTKFLVIDENEAESDYTLMIANYQGYFVQMYITPAEGLEVTQADIDTALEILTSTQVVTK